MALFRERLSKTGRDRIIWNELQRPMESKGINVKKGSAQDATFITSDPGHEKHAEKREEGKTRRSKDGTFAKKNNRTYFGHDPKGINDTMDRRVRNHDLSVESVRRIIRISRKRSLVEYPCAIMKRIISFFTCHEHSWKRCEGEVHVCMFRIQHACTENHTRTALAMKIHSENGRK